MIWLTEKKIIDPFTREYFTYAGPDIEAKSRKEANKKARKLNCTVLGNLIYEENFEDPSIMSLS